MYQLKGGESIRKRKLYGWTGKSCTCCKGSGESPDDRMGRTACGGCGGTGEAWGLMPVQPRDLPPDTE